MEDVNKKNENGYYSRITNSELKTSQFSGHWTFTLDVYK